MKKSLNLFERFCAITMIFIFCSAQLDANPQLPSDFNKDPEGENHKYSYICTCGIRPQFT